MAISYNRAITDDEEKILLDSILDIKQWIDAAIDGKINNCKKRMALRRRDELIKKGDSMIPAKDIDLIKNALADPEYKNRKDRDK